MQRWKVRDMENAAQNCRGEKWETWKMRHINAVVENAGKIVYYGKPLASLFAHKVRITNMPYVALLQNTRRTIVTGRDERGCLFKFHFLPFSAVHSHSLPVPMFSQVLIPFPSQSHRLFPFPSAVISKLVLFRRICCCFSCAS